MEKQHGLAWDERFKLGQDDVDNQHKSLFDLVNKLITECSAGLSTEKLLETLHFLVNYTVRHFEDEEALQLRFDYPGYPEHRKEHEDFKVTVGVLVKRFSEGGSSTELSSDINKIVVKWLINHILKSDKKIGEHIKGRAV